MATRLTRIDPHQNMARWYEVEVQPTLFGEFALERYWGRIGHSGQSKKQSFADEKDAEEMATRIKSAKTRRGYKAIG